MPSIRALPLLLLLAGCAAGPPPSTQVGAERPWVMTSASRVYAAWAPGPTSLATDLGLMSDSDQVDSSVGKLLSVRVTLPDHIRLGFLELRPTEGPLSWLNPTDGMTQALADSVAQALTRIPRIERGVVLPRLVVGDRPTIARLREGSARLQTDLLLVYRPSCQIYSRVPFFGGTDYRAVCTLEMAVLDVRSGVIPVSSVVTREVVAQKRHGDYSDSDRIQRAEFEAVTQALAQDVSELGAYLSGVPVSGPGR
jgi:hypothetical protein